MPEFAAPASPRWPALRARVGSASPIFGVWVLGAVCSVFCAGCGATRSPCAHERCPEDTVCDLDGTCRPLPEPSRAATFSESVALYATSWGNPGASDTASPHRSTLRGDRLLLGGRDDARIDLTFQVPRRRRNVVEAVLVLFPHPHAAATTAAGTLSVSRMRPHEVRETHGPQRAARALPIGRPLSARVERPSPHQALRLDVLRAAQNAEDEPLALRVRISRGGGPSPWLLASPDTPDAALRPRLELLLR